MSYRSVRAKRQIEALASSYRSDRIKDFAKISDGIAVGSGYVLLMGFTVGYQEPGTPIALLVATLFFVGLARAISALADLPRSKKRKIKKFFRQYLRISLEWW